MRRPIGIKGAIGTGMATDRELWALALKVERDHGDDGPRYIAERIGEAALAGEQAGIDLWKAIAVRFDQLRNRSE